MKMQAVVQIPERFKDHVEAAILRFEGQHPGVRVVEATGGYVLDGAGALCDEMRADFLHALYREKIYSETLPMRQALLKAVLG